MVERISRISRSASSAQTEAGNTLNIGSDSENAWVAARQSRINQDIEERYRHALEERKGKVAPYEDEDQDRSGHEAPDALETSDDSAGEPRLSGESERIGTQNFDEDTPFGDRTLIV